MTGAHNHGLGPTLGNTVLHLWFTIVTTALHATDNGLFFLVSNDEQVNGVTVR